jgi:hypothetical protein
VAIQQSGLTPAQQAAVQEFIARPWFLDPTFNNPPQLPPPAGGELRQANPGDTYLPPGLTGYEPPSDLVRVDPFDLPFNLDDIGTVTSIAFGLLDAPGFAIPFLQGMFSPTPPTSPAQAFGTVSGYLLQNLTGDSPQPGRNTSSAPGPVYGPPAPADDGGDDGD